MACGRVKWLIVRDAMKPLTLRWLRGWTGLLRTGLLGLAGAAGGVAADVPAFAVTAPNGETSMLIGSMHGTVDGLVQPDAAQLLQGVRRYVVEALPLPGEQPPGAIAFPPGFQVKTPRADWAAALPPQQVDELTARVRCELALDAATARTFTELMLTRPSAANAAAIAQYRCPRTSTAASRDALLAQAARQRGVEVAALETLEQAAHQRNQIPEPIHRAHLSIALTPAADEARRQAVEALNRGDDAAMLRLLRGLSASDADFQIVLRVLITERNRAWLPALLRYADQGRALINVGAAHLPGPEGVVALLQQRGYRVAPITVPAAR
jgi:uncharacterized protein